MPLPIDTFSNRLGGFTYFKALGHPLAAEGGRKLAERVRAAPSAAVYDPAGQLPAFAALYGLQPDDFQALYVQDSLTVGNRVLGMTAEPITALSQRTCDLLFIPAFDAKGLIGQIGALAEQAGEIVTLDDMRIPERLLTNKRHYLSPLNFATNFAFFRDTEERHTRVVTANYWGGYGAKDPFLWCRLFGENGETLADFERPLGPANASVLLDSRDIRREFDLPAFEGQLFLSVINGAGHDIVKYALDVFGDSDRELSCTHDANAWPSDFYAGLPSPGPEEKVLLWVQNSHPTPMPAGEIGLNLMGDEDNIAYLQEEIPPFGSRALDVSALLPEAKWPQQLEIRAGKWFVRPRYEVVSEDGRRRINHPNVERDDLKHDEDIRRVSPLVGRGFILPAPILPIKAYMSECLPTPMSRQLTNMPLIVTLRDAGGEVVKQFKPGTLPRNHTAALELSAAEFPAGYGHAELTYDTDEPDAFLDGWLHALFRYTERATGHGADTSFGAHMFNMSMTFRNEPQSYKGPPPGLSTRLFLRLTPAPLESFCQLIYPLSGEWRSLSDTHLELKNAQGEDIAVQQMQIPANGSRLFHCSEIFSADDLKSAEGGYILIRDLTCRLFGYHGVRETGGTGTSDNMGDGGFALDHMFGF